MWKSEIETIVGKSGDFKIFMSRTIRIEQMLFPLISREDFGSLSWLFVVFISKLHTVLRSCGGFVKLIYTSFRILYAELEALKSERGQHSLSFCTKLINKGGISVAAHDLKHL